MPLHLPPSDPAAQLQWLVDRAAISDLLIEFARAQDVHDWEGYAATFAEDGVLVIPPDVRHEGRAGLAQVVAASLGRFSGTHHLTSNYAITIDGDTATTRSYLLAAHIFDDADPSRHADGAGWYDNTLRRTAEGWRLTSVSITIRYVQGEPLPPMPFRRPEDALAAGVPPHG